MCIRLMTVHRVRAALRLSTAALALLFMPTLAAADPRLVRIIWDVGKKQAFYRVESRVTLGHDRFEVPPDADVATNRNPFVLVAANSVLRKGDRVRVYVVNYNPVSHLWHESSAVELVAEQPSLVGPLLNALALSITGAVKLSTTTFTWNARDVRPLEAKKKQPCSFEPIEAAVGKLRNAALDVHEASQRIGETARTANLGDNARKVAALPTNRVMWNKFDSAAAWHEILTNADVLGLDFDVTYKSLAKQIEEMKGRITTANTALVEVDVEFAELATVLPDCEDYAKALLAQRDNIVTVLKEVVGEDSAFRETVTRYETANALWVVVRRKLETPTWSGDAVELIVKEPIQADAVLRIDAVFASPVKTVSERIQRTLVLGVQPHLPVLLISGGIGHNGFDFKKLQLVKTTSTAEDGSVSAKNRFDLIDDTGWEPIVPVWLQSVRIVGLQSAGIYGTFGTTPDRNIFKNAIVGGSVFVPKWRTVLTAGVIMARGHETSELQPVIGEFSVDGFALADVNATNVPLPKTRWHKSPYVSVSFVLAQF